MFFANNYLISSLNRIENTAQYSINGQAGVLHEAKQLYSQCMFEMFSVSCNAGSQSLNCAIFPDYTADHSLIKTVPLLLDALEQLFIVLDLVHVNVVPQNLHTARSAGFRSGPLGGHSEGGMKSVRALMQHTA